MDELAYAHRIAAACTRVLGEAVWSVILHGSLALGDYVPGQSDIDLVAIVDRPLAGKQADTLTRALLAEQADAPGPVDFRVVTAATAAAPSEAPPLELYLRLEAGAIREIVTRHPGEPDVAVELSLCRQHGRALLGATPGELIGEVADQTVLRVGDAQVARWQALTDDAPHAALMVLTACRVWRFAETRRHCSKSEAASWVLGRDPSLAAVLAALSQREGEPAPIASADIARLLEIVRARIAASQIDRG